MPEWLWTVIVGVVVVGLISALRANDLRRISELEKRITESAPDVLREKVRNLESDYQTMHLWKNSVLPSQTEQGYRNLYSFVERIERDLIRRVERIENFLNGQLK